MIAAFGLIESLTVLGGAFTCAFAVTIIGWLGHRIHSVARAANALESIADALEGDDEDDDENDKAKGGAK